MRTEIAREDDYRFCKSSTSPTSLSQASTIGSLFIQQATRQMHPQGNSFSKRRYSSKFTFGWSLGMGVGRAAKEGDRETGVISSELFGGLCGGLNVLKVLSWRTMRCVPGPPNVEACRLIPLRPLRLRRRVRSLTLELPYFCRADSTGWMPSVKNWSKSLSLKIGRMFSNTRNSSSIIFSFAFRSSKLQKKRLIRFHVALFLFW